MRRVATAVGALAIVATMATACSSSDSKADDETTTTTAAEATTTTAAPSDAPTEAQLTSALLTAAEMGDGWSVTASDGASSPSCLAPLSDDGTIPGPKVEAQFAYSANGNQGFVFEGLAFAGANSQEAYAAVNTALSTCTQLSAGGAAPSSVEPATITPVGEDSAAYTITFEADGKTFTAQLITALQNNVIVLTMGVQELGVMEMSAMQPIINGAVAKLASAAAASS